MLKDGIKCGKSILNTEEEEMPLEAVFGELEKYTAQVLEKKIPEIKVTAKHIMKI